MCARVCVEIGGNADTNSYVRIFMATAQRNRLSWVLVSNSNHKSIRIDVTQNEEEIKKILTGTISLQSTSGTYYLSSATSLTQQECKG